MPDSELKIKVSIPVDLSGAQQTIAAVQQITVNSTAAERAQAQLDAQLRAASPAALEQVSTRLRELIAQASAGSEEAAHLAAQLERVGAVQTARTDAAARAEELVREAQAQRELAAAEREASEARRADAAREAQVMRERMEAMARNRAVLAELRQSEAQAARAGGSGPEGAAQSFERITAAATSAERAETVFKRTLDSLSPAALKTVEAELKAFIVQEERAGRETGELRGQLARVMSAPFDRAEAGLRKMREEAGHGVLSMRELTEASDHLLSKLTIGYGLMKGGEAVISTIEGIGHAFEEHVRSGIEYLAEMEQRTLSLAATMRSSSPERFGSFDAARQEAGRTVEFLKAKANELGVETGGLIEAYGANYHALIEGGVGGLAKQVQVLSTLMQAEMGKGVTGAQALRDTIDIFNGRAGNIVVAKELGIDPEELRKAIEAGKEYEYIMGKLAGQLEAAGAQSGSFKNQMQTLRNELNALDGLLAGPLFEHLTRWLGTAKSGAGSTQAEVIAKALGSSVGDAAGVLEKFASAVESKPWLQKWLFGGANVALTAPFQAIPFSGLATGALFATEKNIGDNIDRAKAEAAAGGRSVTDLPDSDSADKAAEAERRRKADAEAEARYRDTTRGQKSSDGANLEAAALAQDKLNEKVDKHIEQLTKLYPHASQQWVRCKAEEEVANEHFAGSVEKLNAQTDKIVGKTETAREARQKLLDLRYQFSASIEDSTRSKLTEDQIFKGDPSKNGLLDTVRNLPDSTRDEREEKERLWKIVLSLIEAYKKFNDLESKEKGDVRHIGDAGSKGVATAMTDERRAAAEQKQHDDAVASQKEELAILRAKAAGNDDLAASLEKQRDLQADIKSLMGQNLGYEEALAIATEKQSLEKQAQDAAFRKQKADEAAASRQADFERNNPLAFRPGESAADYHARTGGIDARARDVDPNGGLHGGGATSTAGSLLASKTFTVPGAFAFPDEPGVSTAASQLSPLLSRLPAPGGTGAAGAAGVAGAGGDNSLASSAGRAATASEGSKGAADKLAAGTQGTASALDRIAAAADGAKAAFQEALNQQKAFENRLGAIETKLNTIRAGA